MMSIKVLKGSPPQEEMVFWQAHQSTSTVRPENTMAAFQYAWDLGGIPEGDIRATKDGVIVCMHDYTLKRTTNASDGYENIPIEELTFEQIRRWDAGIKTGSEYEGEKVPSLHEVFEAMGKCHDRRLYLDYKELSLDSLAEIIKGSGRAKQVIFAHNKQDNCIKIKGLIQEIGTMLWIGGSSLSIKEKFEETRRNEFEGLTQVQLHLYPKEDTNHPWFYELDLEFLEYAFKKTRQQNIDLEVLPYEFTDYTIHTILDMGIRWFAVDFPKEFIESVERWGSALKISCK